VSANEIQPNLSAAVSRSLIGTANLRRRKIE